MAFIGNQPTAVPLTSSQLADGLITTAKLAADAVTSAKIADSTIVNADIASTTINLTQKVTGTLPYANGGTGVSTLGTANQVLAVNASATALEFQSVSSDFVRIATTTISSSVATVDFTSVFTSTYDRYIITIDNITADASAYISMRVIYSTNTVDSTTSYTQVGYNATVTTGNTTSSLSVSSYNSYGELYVNFNGQIASGTGTEGKGLSATIHLSTPANTTNGKAMTMQSGFYNGTTYNSQNSFWYYRSTNAITGLRFYTGAGNFTSGTISIYGLKKS